MSAVSNRVIPRSSALWITLREVSRSVRWPKLLQPRPTEETRRPDPPRLRICMDLSWKKGGWSYPLWRACPSVARCGPAGHSPTRREADAAQTRDIDCGKLKAQESAAPVRRGD